MLIKQLNYMMKKKINLNDMIKLNLMMAFKIIFLVFIKFIKLIKKIKFKIFNYI